MRPEPQKEIDLLLRELSRRNGTPVSESGEQHLDADELNSYVANALPPAARTRYTEHLADCSTCRKLVAQLSAAQGAVVARESASVVAPTGLWAFLAGLFSPMVLRYAVPAVGLLVIAVVGIVVLQKKQPDASIAQVGTTDRQRETIVATPSPAETSNATQGLFDKSTEDAKKETPKAAVEAPVTKTAPAEGGGEANKPPAKEETSATIADGPVRNAAEPPRPAKAAPVENEVDVAKDKQQQAADTTAKVSDVSRNRSDDGVANYQKAPEVAATPGSAVKRIEGRRSTPAPATGIAASREDRDEMRRSREAPKTEGLTTLEPEARSVAGRRFRKSGSIWIDTAYQTSQQTTNVARGSEQYRALVADEPAIRTIADQLDGEIIVVWKGRAYRIR